MTKLGRTFRVGILRLAVEQVAHYRKIELSAPSAALVGHDALAQQKWAAWRRKTDVENISLEQLEDQLAKVAQFLDPIFLNAVDPGARWDPSFWAGT